MTTTLVLLRHAKSDWSGGEPDRQRPLAPRGRRQAPEAGRWIAEHVPDLELAVVSSATRTRQTWDLVSAELPVRPEVVVEDAVYAATDAELLAVVQAFAPGVRRAALVGHNPGLEELVGLLTDTWVELPTSAIAVVELDVAWSEVGPGAGRLVTSGRPPA